MHVQDDMLQQTSEVRCKVTMHLIADMEQMARADYLVGAPPRFSIITQVHAQAMLQPSCSPAAELPRHCFRCMCGLPVAVLHTAAGVRHGRCCHSQKGSPQPADI